MTYQAEPWSLSWRHVQHPSRSRYARGHAGQDNNQRWLASIEVEEHLKPCFIHYSRIENANSGDRGDEFYVWLWTPDFDYHGKDRWKSVSMNYHLARPIDHIRILTTVQYAQQFGAPYHVLHFDYIEKKPMVRRIGWRKRAA